MTPESVIEKICADFPGVIPKASWGETSLFYNPEKALPNGVYFCTIKEQNGVNDQASDLDRDGVYRLAIGLGVNAYTSLFGTKPTRPAKGEIVATGHDFTKLNELMPHPIYAWMAWGQILSPTEESFTKIYPLITEAYELAVIKFNKKQRSK